MTTFRGLLPASLACALLFVGVAALRGLEDDAKPEQEADNLVENVLGSVEKVGELGWSLVPEDDPGTRYAPDNLPAELEVEGVVVRFSGEVGEVDPHARMWATPIHLTFIERVDR